jgi:hypothetical protein
MARASVGSGEEAAKPSGKNRKAKNASMLAISNGQEPRQ